MLCYLMLYYIMYNCKDTPVTSPMSFQETVCWWSYPFNQQHPTTKVQKDPDVFLWESKHHHPRILLSMRMVRPRPQMAIYALGWLICGGDTFFVYDLARSMVSGTNKPMILVTISKGGHCCFRTIQPFQPIPLTWSHRTNTTCLVLGLSDPRSTGYSQDLNGLDVTRPTWRGAAWTGGSPRRSLLFQGWRSAWPTKTS